MAKWPATDCNPSTYFYDQVTIFDTTLCGDWSGTSWGTSGSPGQSQSCATRTGVSTCESFVQNHGSAFAEACESRSTFYIHTNLLTPFLDWEVSYVKIFQTS